MFKKSRICTAVLASLGGALMLAPGAVLAQSAERIEVTGTRIKTADTESVSPVVVLDAGAIKVEAVRNVESLLNNLPQVFADYGAQVSNGATGTATVNLRNLGSGRTLVLVNGRRMPAGSPRVLSPDLNQIPVSLVKRVEVLTGGASAVYGSDAVAGVVNFIMNDSFEGLQLEANHSFYNHSQKGAIDSAISARKYPIPGDKDADGQVTDFSLTMGGNFAGNKGNAVLYFGYKKEDALLQSERDFSACAVSASGAKFVCGGSGTSFPGRFLDLTQNKSFTVADANGGVRPYVSATDAYNFAPLNYFQRPSNRYTISALARYDISPSARAYVEASFHDDSTVAQIAPSGLFGQDASGANAIRFENPLLSDAWRSTLGLTAPGSTADLLIFRRNVEGGGRQDDIRHSSFRLVAGVKGDIGNWSYDAFAQTGKVVYQETYKNDFSIARSARALDVVVDPATGNPVCRSALDGSDPSCVPYNIWKLGGVTPAALAYLQTPGFQKGFTSQSVVGANASVDLGSYGFKMPGAKDGASAVFGFERRSEKMDLSTDSAFTTGDLAGQGGPTIGVGGGYTARDLFAELRLPLLQKQAMAEALNLSASYRNSSYSTGPQTDTWGVGFDWAPAKAVKFRASAQRAVRAANIVELYSSQSLGLWNNDEDPCAGATPTASADKCARTGVKAGQYGSIPDSPAQQYNALYGGNPTLKPETADSFTAGVVMQPLRDLSVTVDYFDIKVKDAISTLPPDIVLQQCLDTGNPVFCGLIKRDRIGSIWATPDGYIQATNANVARYSTSGFDIGVDYSMKLPDGKGKLDLSLLGTVLTKAESEPIVGLGTYDCAGLFGNGTCGTPSPKWRHKARANWGTPWGVDVAVTWRYFGKVSDEVTSSNPLLTGTVNAIQETLGARNYIDVSAALKLSKSVTLRGTINNLFDRDPPLAATGAPFGNGNTYPVVYDALGRRISLNLTASF